MKDSKAIKEFKIDKAIYSELSKGEMKTLPLLAKAANILASIYADQEQGYTKFPGANFYPHDVSNQEIEKAASINPEILSPYTVVEKSAKGIVAIPYHFKYKDSLQKISKLLYQASKISNKKIFSDYLKTASESLLSGDYKRMDLAWLATNDSNLQFLIGPYERYLDKRFFKKMAYLAFIGIKDPSYTKKAQEIRDIILNSVGDKPHYVISPSKIQICPVRNILFAGFLSRSVFSFELIPSDDQTIKESGSRLLSYLSSIDYKFDKLLYPIFNNIFDKRFKESYSEDLLRKANYDLVTVYGLARQIHHYEGSRERLKELLPVFEEISSIVSGNQHCKHLVLKGAIGQKELEAIIIMHICWLFSEWIISKKTNVREDYLKGDAIALNFLIKEGALKEKEGISWPNFAKMFFEMENLSIILNRLLENGSYSEAQGFLSKYLSYAPFEVFDRRLSRIKPI